ncbi:TPA: class B sortase [Streptococcus equi subsp. zooepidemicus]|nr:class B sortase [Streptococcus equi subsp. zooepidemicus]HEL0012269.1 class B sortase [Streptococcus equi subsp. zooepidemicus]HEL0014332.1 class B sortase [Streptococcus equi subsp. zooepidemicus]HEL0018399.1 class B sortase [Streptococcus equi subsp. zooepidemicus]HEL0030258.1 class B sortase [Streptococcus equi subsp. zooepidemicus]
MKSKRKNIFLNLIMVICLFVFLFSAFQISKTLINEKKEADEFNDLKTRFEHGIKRNNESTKKKNKETNENVENDNSSNTEKVNAHDKNKRRTESTNENQETIYEENGDLVGWIQIPDTPIDYPVMSTPRNPNFYLRKNFYKEKSLSGTPFIGEGLSPNAKSFIVYAHNMKNGSMFGTLEEYENEEYRNDHRYVYFTTTDEERVYEVVAAFRVMLDGLSFGYYNYCGDWTKEEFNRYFERVFDLSVYDKKEPVSYDNQIMTLSTCSSFIEKERFVVVTKRVR